MIVFRKQPDWKRIGLELNSTIEIKMFAYKQRTTEESLRRQNGML